MNPALICFEDEHLLVVNKPAGLVVHPGAGNPAGTLMNALLHHDPGLADVPRAGIVHRLDKDTTGLLLVARTAAAHTALVRMLESDEMAGAGLDVFEHEPAVSPKLLKLAQSGKVTLLPHMGSATNEGRVDMGEKVIINIRTFMDGHRPPDRVLPSML